MASQPIIRLLTDSGLGSRRQIAAVIKRGGVAVNGEAVQSFNQPVDPDSDVITVDGQRVSVAAEPVIYLMLNKPRGIMSSTVDRRGGKTVVDILPEKYRNLRLYPVGRLDKDSTGLILLTNDGDLTFRLTHPRFEQEKEYLVTIGKHLKAEDRAELETGIRLHDGTTSPAAIRAVASSPSSYSVTVHEGRKRQVRRMFAALGYRVVGLKRIRLAKLSLGALPEGAVRELTRQEIRSLKEGAGGISGSPVA